jgi:hypothetical protein
MSIIWIAACIYFAWSPDLACAGLLVVCGVVGWITIFIHAPYVCASTDDDQDLSVYDLDIISTNHALSMPYNAGNETTSSGA